MHIYIHILAAYIYITEKNETTQKKAKLRLKRYSGRNIQCYSKRCIAAQNTQYKIAMNSTKPHITPTFQAITPTKNDLKQAVDPVSKRNKQNNCNKAINDNEILLLWLKNN